MTRLRDRGIAVTAVTKATLGSPEMVNAWIQAGVSGLGDSRIENIEALRGAAISAPTTLIRSPMLSQAERIVASADVSLNTELEVIRALSVAATKLDRNHGVVLMVELGDLREGIMPDLLIETVREVLRLPNITFKGVGTNLACRSGVSPDQTNMATLSALADTIDATFGQIVEIVSGGNSANLSWALSGAGIGRINDLRLGEALLLGVEPLHREPLPGLHTDAIT
ncbi:MAG: alanine racemase, partial [Verrucomicrobiales bacterium]|nr:alanine racemase [Verrucomicrobiales bacterium]